MIGNWGMAPLRPIGTHGLVGSAQHGMITVRGPCGEGHTMNMEAARELRDWLTEQLVEEPVQPVAESETRLNAEQSREFVKALISPSEPSPVLREAARFYQDTVRQKSRPDGSE